MTGYQVDLYIATHETVEISDDLSLRLLETDAALRERCRWPLLYINAFFEIRFLVFEIRF